MQSALLLSPLLLKTTTIGNSVKIMILFLVCLFLRKQTAVPFRLNDLTHVTKPQSFIHSGA